MSPQESKAEQGRRSVKYPLLLTILSGLSFIFLLVLLVLVGSSFETLESQLGFQQPEGASIRGNGVYDIEIVDGQTIYVPIYSHIFADGGKPHLLEATLSIRNLDPDNEISVKAVKYFDTGGKLVNSYLDNPLTLAPLETTEFLVKKRDTRGGSGANFIVVWDAAEPVYEPLVEAVMVGFSGANSISFSSPGRVLLKHK